MSCGMGMIKYLLFIFNFVFAICGLAILTLGVLAHLQMSEVTEHIDTNLEFPSITLIVLGSVIFVIAFFGCCGAIRESHCMTITFASFLMFILLVQVAVAVYVFVVVNKSDVREEYTKVFNNYSTDNTSKDFVDLIQKNLKCCGIDSSRDFNGEIPESCCDKSVSPTCSSTPGCVQTLKDTISKLGTILGSVAVGIAGVELIGIIFALCLANSIKNIERRGYRV